MAAHGYAGPVLLGWNPSCSTTCRIVMQIRSSAVRRTLSQQDSWRSLTCEFVVAVGACKIIGAPFLFAPVLRSGELI